MIVTIKKPTAAKIKKLVHDGVQVYWANEGYIVSKDTLGNYNVINEYNNHCIGLTDKKGNLLNTNQKYFYSAYDYLITSYENKMMKKNGFNLNSLTTAKNHK
tara:strand:- start:491 stop:796 length:306 start_codon:yes stop_codon:yes gene_type:complete